MVDAVASRHTSHLALYVNPVVLLLREQIAVTIAADSLCKIAEAMGLAWQSTTGIDVVEVFNQDAPRHTVDSNMMANQQQAVATVCMDESGLEDRTFLQVNRRMYLVGGLLYGCFHICNTPEVLFYQFIERLVIFRTYDDLSFADGSTQHIVMAAEGCQGIFQLLLVYRLGSTQDDALVEMCRLRQLQLEEELLDGRWQDIATDSLL